MAILAAIAEPTGQPLRILIADDHEIIRNAVRSILEKVPRFQLAGEACDGAEAIEKALQLRPDVVILNISMPILNGLDAARQLTARLPGTAVVILSSNADQHFVDLARKSGARAYVSKSKAVASLVSAIEASVRGTTSFWWTSRLSRFSGHLLFLGFRVRKKFRGLTSCSIEDVSQFREF